MSLFVLSCVFFAALFRSTLFSPADPCQSQGGASEKKCRAEANYKRRSGATQLGSTSDINFAVAQRGFQGFARGSTSYVSTKLRTGLYKRVFLGGSEGDVRQCRRGAGNPLRWSGSWGFAAAERGFRSVARGSSNYVSRKLPEEFASFLSKIF